MVLRREDDTACGAEQLPQRGVIEAPRERDVPQRPLRAVARDRLERGALASLAHDDQTHAKPSERANGDVGALVRGQPSDVDPEISTFALRRERVDVDRRMHDLALAVVVPADPFGDDGRVRDPPVDARGEGQVGITKTGKQLAHDSAKGRGDLVLQIFLARVPQIPRRRVAVRDLDRAVGKP